MHHLRLFAAWATIAALPTQAVAQATAADAITAGAITRHINALASDSMRNRATPSPGLERTAQYVAEQFKALGLQPGGLKGSWFQRYQLRPRLDLAQSHVTFTDSTRRVVASFMTNVYLEDSRVPRGPVTGTAAVVSGESTSLIFDSVAGQGKVILFVLAGKTTVENVMESMYITEGNLTEGSPKKSFYQSVIFLNRPDSAIFAGQVHRAQQQFRGQVSDRRTWIGLLPEATKGMVELLAAHGVDLAKARRDTTPEAQTTPANQIHEMPGVQVSIDIPLHWQASDTATAPNVIGVIEGSDPKLKEEYLVFSTHMDHLGAGPGANENASGVAGLIELARAFSQPGARPARSLIFLATSGGRNDIQGSERYTEQVMITGFWDGGLDPKKGVANITLDMIGRKGGDSVTIDGVREVEFAPQLVTSHPELGLTVIDTGSAFSPTSDHFAFLRHGVPSLYFHTGTHDDGRETADSGATIDPEREARILRLAFYVGQMIAETPRKPRWSKEGYQAFSQLGGD